MPAAASPIAAIDATATLRIEDSLSVAMRAMSKVLRFGFVFTRYDIGKTRIVSSLGARPAALPLAADAQPQTTDTMVPSSPAASGSAHGPGHWHVPELAHGLAPAANKDGKALVSQRGNPVRLYQVSSHSSAHWRSRPPGRGASTTAAGDGSSAWLPADREVGRLSCSLWGREAR